MKPLIQYGVVFWVGLVPKNAGHAVTTPALLCSLPLVDFTTMLGWAGLGFTLWWT